MQTTPRRRCRGIHRLPRRFRRQLADAGIDLVTPTAPDAADAAVLVLTSSARKAPGPFPGTSWLWLSGAPVTDATARRRDRARRLRRRRAGRRRTRSRASVRGSMNSRSPLPHPPADASLALASDAARAVAQQVAHVASTSMSVLFTGETGTGKEVMARLTHAWSARALKPFVPINCAAIPNELMEAELFGYARGAFSGAVQRYDGQLMAAERRHGVSRRNRRHARRKSQVKLLRVLEDHVVSRLGENEWHEVDFRLLAATNRDLGAFIDAGLFGADLYERLAIVTIELPPLRARLDDLPLLARHFMARFAREQVRTPVVTDQRRRAARAARVPVAGQHPRAAQRALRDARLQARRRRDPAVRSAAPPAEAIGGRRHADPPPSAPRLRARSRAER